MTLTSNIDPITLYIQQTINIVKVLNDFSAILISEL